MRVKNEETSLKAKKRSRKLVNLLYKSRAEVIMDDAKYFCFDGYNIPGSARYYTMLRRCSKRKILMWITISNRGISKPYFRLSKSVAVNSNIYITECLQPKLLPFIHKHQSNLNYFFWPDLVEAYYSNETVAWMEENVHFVEKFSNSPNVPQARSIENLLGILGSKVYEGE